MVSNAGCRGCMWAFEIIVKYDSPIFVVGDVVINRSHFYGQYVTNNLPISVSTQNSLVLTAPVCTGPSVSTVGAPYNRFLVGDSIRTSIYILNNNIFRFEIAMYDSMAVKKRNCFKDIRYNFQYLTFLKYFPLLYHFQQMARKTTLHNEVQILFVIKETIKFYNIRMVQIHLYLNFPKNELLHFKLFYFLFGQTLQNTQKFAFFVPSQENISISSFPNFLDHFEVFYSYLPSWYLLYFMKLCYV